MAFISSVIIDAILVTSHCFDAMMEEKVERNVARRSVFESAFNFVGLYSKDVFS